MSSTAETIFAALQGVISAALTPLGATVERNTSMPDRIGPQGHVTLREADPGEPYVTMSPLEYEYEHQIDIEVLVSGTDRDATFDALKVAIGAAVLANRTLGGLCIWLEATPPADLDDLAMHEPVKAAVIVLFVTYKTSNPLG
ncbi:acyl-CoA transferase [Pseudoroseicyclus sp. CXY001]|uniref:acyl-CoA transferase n=1 Tax=Pseudoroseicyclus sp. CXY001 TaxID=3242492 RepID=UPI0035710ECF